MKKAIAITVMCCALALAMGLTACGGSSSSGASGAAAQQSQSAESASSSAAAPQDPDAEFLPELAAGLEARWKFSNQIAGQELTADKREQLAQAELDHIAAFKNARFKDPELGKLAERYIAAVEDSIDSLSQIDSNYIDFAKRWSDSYKERSLVIKELVGKYGFKVADAYQASLDGIVEDAKASEAEEAVPADIRQAANEEIPATLASAFRKGDDGMYRATVANPTRATFDYYNFTVCLLDAKGGLAESFSFNVENWATGAEASFEFAPTKEFATIAVLPDFWWATWQI